MKQGTIRTAVVAVVLAAVVAAPASGWADDVSRAKSDAGVGLATAVANVVYIPAKLVYALVGGITGGLAYGLTAGNKQVAERVWVSSFGGDYIMSREQLQGQQPIRFTGSADPNM